MIEYAVLFPEYVRSVRHPILENPNPDVSAPISKPVVGRLAPWVKGDQDVTTCLIRRNRSRLMRRLRSEW